MGKKIIYLTTGKRILFLTKECYDHIPTLWILQQLEIQFFFFHHHLSRAFFYLSTELKPGQGTSFQLQEAWRLMKKGQTLWMQQLPPKRNGRKLETLLMAENRKKYEV